MSDLTAVFLGGLSLGIKKRCICSLHVQVGLLCWVWLVFLPWSSSCCCPSSQRAPGTCSSREETGTQQRQVRKHNSSFRTNKEKLAIETVYYGILRGLSPSALQRLRGWDDVDAELTEMRLEDQSERAEGHLSVLSLLSRRSLRWQLVSIIIMNMGQQLSGVNAVSRAHHASCPCTSSWPNDAHTDSVSDITGCID